MKFILDFDHTLLDTERFVNTVRRDGREDILITPEIWKYYNVRDFLYDDVLPWLSSKSKNDLHILTAITPHLGELSAAFQKEKLNSGHFDEFVSEITFMVGMKGDVASAIAKQWSATETVIFIDDRPDQCHSVKLSLPNSHCFIIDRDKRGILSESNFPVVYDLAEVSDIINSHV